MMLSVIMDKDVIDDMSHYIIWWSLCDEFLSSGSIKDCVFIIVGCFCHEDSMNHVHPCLCYHKIR